MLEIANLEVVYNDVALVLRGFSLEVRDGQIVALLGGNGAGKTTTLRAIINGFECSGQSAQTNASASQRCAEAVPERSGWLAQ